MMQSATTKNVVNHIIFENLNNIILVGHSFAGSVISGVADRLKDRIQKLIYFDAMILIDGQKPFDITPYVNPKWDESFYPSTYTKKRWKQVKPKVLAYCDKRFDAKKMARFNYYKKLDRENASTKYLKERIKKGKLKGQEAYRLDNLCSKN